MTSVVRMETPTGWDADTVADVLGVLADLPEWRLSPQRWDQVSLILDLMDAAVARGDAEELRDAVAELALRGPTRILRIGTSSSTGAPDQVLERRNKLVHVLAKERPPAPAPGPKGSRGDERPR